VTWRQLPAIWETPLRPTDKLVLLCLAQFANQIGKSAYPAQATIGRLTGISLRSVRYALSRLRDAGLIVPQGKGPQGTIKYQINLPLASSQRGGAAPVAYPPGNGLPTIQGRNPVDKKIVIDSFSDLNSPPEPAWKAAQRSQRNRRR
jgi:hypothetical protein